MTRASLLHILDNLGGISETEVQELERLAATFPYCQTAHLLLAKAAHDRGSMLAAQRLRRAATYAVDRQLLRALIELAAPLSPAEVSAPTGEAQGEALPTTQLALTAQTTLADSIAVEPESAQGAVNFNSSEIELPHNQPPGSVSITEAAEIQDFPADKVAPADEVPTEIAFPEAEAVSLDTAPEILSRPSLEAPLELETPTHKVDEPLLEPLSEPTTDTNPTVDEEPLKESVEVEAAITAAMEEAPDVVKSEVTVEESLVSAAETADSVVASELKISSELVEEELPLAPPPVRPPAEVGSSRFEFGLAQTLLVAIPTYSLFEVEKVVAKQTAVIPPFWADEEVGYAPGLGSRLGFCLQAHDEYSLDLPPSAFFEPDALLLQHLKQHQPVPPPVPTSIDLIDKFLRSKPRFRAPLPLPPTTEAQADLSVRSTLAEPGLASESLARILVRQGKIAKAIQIYERLIARQPEKKAYFADQIQQLQTFE